MQIEENKINEIKSKSDIVEVISRYLPLEKKGQNYFGVCPFHQDTSPSMSVSPQKQIFKCFSCGASGNVISFVMDYESLSFVEALRKLAQTNNIDFNYQNEFVRKVNPEFQVLYDLNLKVANLYNFQLHKTKSGNVHLYKLFEERKLTKDVIDFFNLGFATNDDNVLEMLSNNGYSNDVILNSALVNEKDSRRYDNFRNKIMIPIFDEFNNIVGFSGRAIDDSKPKYINSRETLIFKKSEILYNFNNAKHAIKQKKRIFITEGYFDVIKAYQHDLKEVVATMGTALTNENLKKITKLGATLYFCLDSDEAGQSAMFNIFSKLDFQKIYVINLIDTKDLDEFLDKYDINVLEEQVKNAKNHITFQLDFLFKRTNINDQFQKRELIDSSMKIINKINDNILKESFIIDFAQKVNVSRDFLIDKQVEVKFSMEPKIQVVQNTDAEFELLARMLLFPEVIKTFQKEMGIFENPNYTAFAFEIIDHHQNYNSINLDVFETRLLSHNKMNLFPIFIKIKEVDDLEKSNLEIIELIYSLKKRKIVKQRNHLEGKRNIVASTELLKLEIEIIKLKQIEDKIEQEKKYYEENLNE